MATPELQPTLEHPAEQPKPSIQELKQRVEEAHRLLDEQLELSGEATLDQASILDTPEIQAAKPDFGDDESPAELPAETLPITSEIAAKNLGDVLAGGDQAKKVIEESQLDKKLADPNVTPDDVEGDPFDVVGKFYGRSPDR